MKVKVLSTEIGRMMRILSGCIDPRDEKNSNVEISHNNNMFSIRAVNNGQFVKMSTPLLGGDGETFCVDGKMFANIIGRSTGDVEITTDDKICLVKSNGRTRIPIVNVKLPIPAEVSGSTFAVTGEDFISVTDRVRYASAQDDTRPILTGVLLNVEHDRMTMAAVDGFQMAVESVYGQGDDMNIVVPNMLLKRICDCAGPEECVGITTDGSRISFCTDTAEITGSVLHGDFIDYQKIVPTSFTTSVLINVEELKDALKGSGVVGNVKNLVKFIIHSDHLTVTSNSERADFEADVPCQTNGNELTIAFNDKYVMNALSALEDDEIVIHLNTPVSPAIFSEKPRENLFIGTHLVLPVRVM